MSLSLEELGPWGLRSQAEMRRRRRKGVTGAGAELERCWPGHSMGQVGTGGPYPPGGFFPHANILAAFLGLSGPQMRQRNVSARANCPAPEGMRHPRTSICYLRTGKASRGGSHHPTGPTEASLPYQVPPGPPRQPKSRRTRAQRRRGLWPPRALRPQPEQIRACCATEVPSPGFCTETLSSGPQSGLSTCPPGAP